MAGKPTIPSSTLAKIRRLAKRGGHSERVLAEMCSVSLYTVRKALRGAEYVEQQRARWRAIDAERLAARAADPAYREYQAQASSTPERREQVRVRMAALRAARRKQAS